MKAMFRCNKCGANSNIIAPASERYKCPVCGEGELVIYSPECSARVQTPEELERNLYKESGESGDECVY